MTQVLATLAAALPVLLAAGAVATLVNQAVQAAFPGTKFAHAVSTITVDYVAFVTALAPLFKGKSPGYAKLNAMYLVAVLFGVSCMAAGACTAAQQAQAARAARDTCAAVEADQHPPKLPPSKPADSGVDSGR
jgi:hypothetical protein